MYTHTHTATSTTTSKTPMRFRFPCPDSVQLWDKAPFFTVRNSGSTCRWRPWRNEKFGTQDDGLPHLATTPVRSLGTDGETLFSCCYDLVFGLWRVYFPPVLIRTDRRLLV